MFNLREIISYNNQLILFILFSFLIGTTSTYLWISSNNNWNIYLKKAYNFGINIHNDISYGYKSINNEEFQELNFLHDQLSTEEILKNVNFPSQNLITSFSMLNENKLLNNIVEQCNIMSKTGPPPPPSPQSGWEEEGQSDQEESERADSGSQSD